MMLRAHLLVLFLATLLDSALGGWEAEIDPFSTKLGGYREYDLSDAEREHDLMIHGCRKVGDHCYAILNPNSKNPKGGKGGKRGYLVRLYDVACYENMQLDEHGNVLNPMAAVYDDFDGMNLPGPDEFDFMDPPPPFLPERRAAGRRVAVR
ncbi:hypothetical protein E4U54_000629 [Claviceps lovelessii]|nr:hypothetical protein E4U54_000629 [Claviceps lovelessii]